jgi:thioredoxin reductase (NADPH)
MNRNGDTASPTLTQDQIQYLTHYGEIGNTEVGQVLIKAGDISSPFIVVDGEVEVIDDFAGKARTMGILRAGNFVGELNMLTGQALYLSFVVRKRGKVLAIPRKQLKEVVTEDPTLSDIILKAFLARRSIGMRAGVGLRIIGSRHSSDATRLREYATRNRLVHGWIEVGEDPGAEALLEEFGVKPSETPVTIWQARTYSRTRQTPSLPGLSASR